jgi:hypothetical protein
MTDAATAEIRAMRERLARLEQIAKAAVPPPPDTASFGDAMRALARDGTASGPSIDSLRAQITGSSEPTPDSPADQPGPDPIEEAYQRMKLTAARRDAIETVSPGASGRIDVLSPGAASAIDKIRRVLSEEH